jgi:hypothetical protein
MNRAQNIDGIRAGLDFVNQAVVVPVSHHLAMACPREYQKEEQKKKIASAWFMLVVVYCVHSEFLFNKYGQCPVER